MGWKQCVAVTVCTLISSSSQGSTIGLSGDAFYIANQLAEATDRVLVAQDRLEDEMLTLETENAAFSRIEKAGNGTSRRRYLEAKHALEKRAKLIEERKQELLIAQTEVEIWKLHQTQPSGVGAAYRKLWEQRTLAFEKAFETASVIYAYQKERHESLRELALSGVIPVTQTFEASLQVKEAAHHMDLAKQRAENAKQFMR